MRISILLACAALAACALGPPAGERALVGRVWEPRAGAFASADAVYAEARRARHVIFGETHDNAEHHRLQLRALEALAPGAKRVLAMEQFDSEYQAAIDAAIAAGADAERVADAGHFDRKGWNWPLYKPLVQFALEHRWPIVAANLSREEARAIVADPARAALPPAPPAVQRALERDIIEGHCGAAPPAARLAGMVAAQRARDARMAQALSRYERSVLITGIGHARRDRDVPLYLGDADVLSIAFVETDADKKAPRDYFDGFATRASFDYAWFTERAPREDPCK